MTSSRFATLAIAAALTAAAAAQEPPRFEVASVRPSPDPTPTTRGGVTISEGQARFSFLSLKDYLTIAYGLRIHQIAGPDWLGSTRFEVAGTIPAGVKPDQMPAMLRALLEDRFQLRSRRESREFPVYALEVSAGASKLVRVPDQAPPPGPFTVTSGGGPGGIMVDLGDGSTLTLGNNHFEAKRVTMVTLADTLGRFVDRPVVNMTNLEGRYDVVFEMRPEDFQAMMIRSAVSAGVTLPPQAMQLLDTASPAAVPDALKSLGLELRSTRAPQDVLVVESINRTPTEN